MGAAYGLRPTEAKAQGVYYCVYDPTGGIGLGLCETVVPLTENDGCVGGFMANPDICGGELFNQSQCNEVGGPHDCISAIPEDEEGGFVIFNGVCQFTTEEWVYSLIDDCETALENVEGEIYKCIPNIGCRVCTVQMLLSDPSCTLSDSQCLETCTISREKDGFKLPPCGTGDERKTDVMTALGCMPLFRGINDVAGFFWKWAIGISGGIALLVIVYAGFLYMTSQGDPSKLAQSKELVLASMGGLILITMAGFVLRLLGIDILGLFG